MNHCKLFIFYMPKISKARALELLQNSSGKFCSVTFMKKDKTMRKLNGKVQNTKTPLGYVKMLENSTSKKQGGIRNVNLQTLNSIRINKVTYNVA